MASIQPKFEFDDRFSEPEAKGTPWDGAVRVLKESELYWITTVRRQGKPHVTPMVGVWSDGAMYFCTGPGE